MERIDHILGYDESLKIIQESDGFNFSIDSLVLSFFMMPKLKTSKIIDLGTGNGFIPLIYSMMTNKKIYGIEISEAASDRAKRSVELNNLSDRITIINDDIKNLRNHFKQAEFSLVVSNPPYFREIDSKDKNLDEDVKASRHETKITFKELVKEASYLLTDKGSFACVQTTDRFIEVIETLKEHRLYPKRIRLVYPIKGKESHIFLIEAVKNGSDHGLKILEPLYIYEKENEYSKEILEYFRYKKDEKK